jgi:hypothetical protein
MSRKKSHEEIIGNDSFLDVVANVVGILIILLMVVSLRAKDEILHAETVVETQQESEPKARLAEFETAKSAEHQVQQDIHRIDDELKREQLEVKYREAERDRAQLLVTAAEQSLSEERNRLTEAQRTEFDRRNELAAGEAALQQLREGIAFVQSSKPNTTILEHLPTPMAKTVFGKEIHLRLRLGRVTHVPWDDFIQLLKTEAPKTVWRLQDQDECTEMVGPLGGFWMHYTLKRKANSITTKVGIATQTTIVLDRFTLTPETETMGESVDAALRDGSQLLSILASHQPSNTTITVWTYPDSFNEFRKLKQELFKRGYMTAARPLPDDHPIGGSPEGSRSAAQ